MNRITNHASDTRKYGCNEYDLDIDLASKPSAYMVAFKRHYTGNVTHQSGGYRQRDRNNKAFKNTVTSMKRWHTLRLNKAHHNAEIARRKAAEEAKIDRRPRKVKKAEWMAKKKAAKKGGR